MTQISNIMAALIIITISVVIGGVAYLVSSTKASVLTLEQSPCHPTIITDKFQTTGGGFAGVHTTYYVVDENKTVYYLLTGEDPTEEYLWVQIVKNQTYSLKTSGKYASFCEFELLKVKR